MGPGTDWGALWGDLGYWRPLGAGRLGADVRVQLEPCLVGHSILWRTVPATQAGQAFGRRPGCHADEETAAGMRFGRHNRDNDAFKDLTKFSLGSRGLYWCLPTDDSSSG